MKKIKIFSALTSLAIAAASAPILMTVTSCGDKNPVYESDMSITAEGALSLSSTCANPGRFRTLNVPNKLKNITVKSIAENGFIKAINLEIVSFKNAAECTAIGEGAFKDLSKITSIEWNNIINIGRTSFSNCTSIKSLKFDKIQIFGGGCFSGCTSLANVKIDTSWISAEFAISVGTSIFENCTSLTFIETSFSTVASIQYFILDSNSFNKIAPKGKIKNTPPTEEKYLLSGYVATHFKTGALDSTWSAFDPLDLSIQTLKDFKYLASDTKFRFKPTAPATSGVTSKEFTDFTNQVKYNISADIQRITGLGQTAIDSIATVTMPSWDDSMKTWAKSEQRSFKVKITSLDDTIMTGSTGEFELKIQPELLVSIPSEFYHSDPTTKVLKLLPTYLTTESHNAIMLPSQNSVDYTTTSAATWPTDATFEKKQFICFLGAEAKSDGTASTVVLGTNTFSSEWVSMTSWEINGIAVLDPNSFGTIYSKSVKIGKELNQIYANSFAKGDTALTEVVVDPTNETFTTIESRSADIITGQILAYKPDHKAPETFSGLGWGMVSIGPSVVSLTDANVLVSGSFNGTRAAAIKHIIFEKGFEACTIQAKCFSENGIINTIDLGATFSGKIETEGFYNCAALTSIGLGTMKLDGTDMFKNLPALNSITFKYTSMPTPATVKSIFSGVNANGQIYNTTGSVLAELATYLKKCGIPAAWKP